MRRRSVPSSYIRWTAVLALTAALGGCSLRDLNKFVAGGSGGAAAGTGGAGANGGQGGSGGSAVGGGGQGGGQGGSGGMVDPLPFCPPEGWCRLLDTKLATSACPLGEDCGYLFEGNNSGVVDPKTGALYLWGSSSFSGNARNAVYRLDAQKRLMEQVLADDPFVDDANGCYVHDGSNVIIDRPTPRQPFSGLAAIPLDRATAPDNPAWGIMALGGFGHCPSDVGRTFMFSFDAQDWNEVTATVDGNNELPSVLNQAKLAYDPNSGDVFFVTQNTLWKYDIEQSDYLQLVPNGAPNHLRSVAGIFPDYEPIPGEPKSVLFAIAGNPSSKIFVAVLLENPYRRLDGSDMMAPADLTPDSSCNPLLEAIAPGFAYHPKRKVFVGWTGTSSTVYIYDPLAKHCTPLTGMEDNGQFPNVPINGVRGHWSYSEAIDAFIAVTDWEQDAFVFRLPPE